jgi:hypothetical protein
LRWFGLMGDVVVVVVVVDDDDDDDDATGLTLIPLQSCTMGGDLELALVLARVIGSITSNFSGIGGDLALALVFATVTLSMGVISAFIFILPTQKEI